MSAKGLIAESPQVQNRANLATGFWTQVLRGRFSQFEVGVAAMSHLCNAYSPAVKDFLLRLDADSSWAEKRAQQFVTYLSSGNYLHYLRLDRTHFRHFLLDALRSYLADDWIGRSNLGSCPSRFSVLEGTGEITAGRCIATLEKTGSPLMSEAARDFGRKWALTAIQRALRKMQVEGNGSDSPKLYLTLCGYLSGSREIPYETFKTTFGLSEGATKLALQRLRFRFGEFLRAEIRDTVQSEELVVGEIQTLCEIVS